MVRRCFFPLLLLLASCTTPVQCVRVVTSPSFRSSILREQNLRRCAMSVGALAWDDCLEQSALVHAEACVTGHDTNAARQAAYAACGGSGSVGQNIAYGTVDPSTIVTMWVDSERPNFDCTTSPMRGADCAGGAVFGHYTQAVGTRATRVGCAAVQDCDDPGAYSRFTARVVCNYASAVNYHNGCTFQAGYDPFPLEVCGATGGTCTNYTPGLPDDGTPTTPPPAVPASMATVPAATPSTSDGADEQSADSSNRPAVDEDEEGGLSGGVIAAIVVLLLAAVAAAAFVAYRFRRYRRRHHHPHHHHHHQQLQQQEQRQQQAPVLSPRSRGGTHGTPPHPPLVSALAPAATTPPRLPPAPAPNRALPPAPTGPPPVARRSTVMPPPGRPGRVAGRGMPPGRVPPSRAPPGRAPPPAARRLPPPPAPRRSGGVAARWPPP